MSTTQSTYTYRLKSTHNLIEALRTISNLATFPAKGAGNKANLLVAIQIARKAITQAEGR